MKELRRNFPVLIVMVLGLIGFSAPAAFSHPCLNSSEYIIISDSHTKSESDQPDLPLNKENDNQEEDTDPKEDTIDKKCLSLIDSRFFFSGLDYRQKVRSSRFCASEFMNIFSPPPEF